MNSWRVLLFALVLACAGCGDDDGGDEGASGGSGGSGGSSTAGGGATSGGGAGSAGSPVAGSQGVDASTGDAGGGGERVICGGVGGFICRQSLEVMGRTLAPCCDEDSGNICGVGFGGQCEGLNQPGDASDECPSEQGPTGDALPGCCRPDGRCGLLLTVGFGCVERSDVSEIGVGPFDAMSCGPEPADDGGAP